MDDEIQEIERVEKVFGKVNRADTKYEVFASAKVYPNLIKIFIPKEPYMKDIPFMEKRIDDLDELEEDWPTLVNLDKEKEEENIERSLRRTKTLITDLTLCNEFDLFATFTFSPKKTADRMNPAIVKLQMANWLRNQRSRNGRFPYLIVPEFHKDGKALHFHALFKDYTGELIDTGRNHKGRKLHHFKEYTLGFNSAVVIDDVNKVLSYVRKYITKDMPQFRSKHRFWASLGLKRPIIVDNPPDEYFRYKIIWNRETEHGRVLCNRTNSYLASKESIRDRPWEQVT